MSRKGAQVVLITGASGGIGRALVEGFLADGERVVALSRSRPAARRGANPRLVQVAADLTVEAEVRRAVGLAEKRFGSVDVLINNAGAANWGGFLDRPFSEWSEVVGVNLIGLALCTYVVLPGMIERGFGRIINIASRSAENPTPGKSAYAASKAGVSSFTLALAREVAALKCDLLVNAVVPGPTRTGMNPRGQDPSRVFPHVRFAAKLPAGGPNGKTFWESRAYPMFARFNG